MCAAWERASLRGMSVVVGKHSRWGPQHEHAERTAGACDEVEEARRDGVVKSTLSDRASVRSPSDRPESIQTHARHTWSKQTAYSREILPPRAWPMTV